MMAMSCRQRADRFQIVRDCSIVSIVNNRKKHSAKRDRGYTLCTLGLRSGDTAWETSSLSADLNAAGGFVLCDVILISTAPVGTNKISDKRSTCTRALLYLEGHQ